MKNLLFIISFSMLLSQTSGQQKQGGYQTGSASQKRVFPVRINLGVNMSTLTGDNIKSARMYFGVFGGVRLTWLRLGRRVFLDTEADLSVQGARYRDNNDPGTEMLHYFNVPVTARYQWLNGLFFEAGLQPGWLLKATWKTDNGSEDNSNEFNSFDLAIPFGFGFEWPKGWGLSFRLSPGLLNIRSLSESDNRNLVTSLRIHYHI